MRNDPYSDDSIGMAPDSTMPPMEDLPAKRPQPSLPYTPFENATIHETENGGIAFPEIDSEEIRATRFAVGKVNDLLQWFLVVLEIMLTVRFLLRLIGADPSNLFAGFLYALTAIPLFLFSNIVPTFAISASQAFELSTLIAMAIYWLLFWSIRRFLRILISEPEESLE